MPRWRSSCRCWPTGSLRPEIAEDATQQYRLAALRTVGELPDRGVLGSSLRTILGSFDNDQSSLVDLLAGLLPRREQWLGHLAGRRASELRAELERALERLVVDELRSLTELWPEPELEELNALLAHAAANLTVPATRVALAEWLRAPETSEPAVRLVGWQAAARLLLTQKGEWRQKVTKTDGFGSRATHGDEPLARAARDADRATSRCDWHSAQSPRCLRHVSTTCSGEALLRCKSCSCAWQRSSRWYSAEQRCVDFVELSVAAQRALGHAEAPSELLLALDRRIQHLLVDEFQDTSQAQLRLLALLTSGWQPDDGRSLFLVGDPMQSIYRFRDADMSLFLRVKERGIGQVRLTPLRLQRNFRSSPAVVDWVNRVFATVFPEHDDLDGGLAGFVPSMAVREAAAAQFVSVHPLLGTDARAEVETVIDIIRAERARDERQSIAVLVQSRTHLAGLHELLDAHGWPVHAIEIDAPAERQIGQDLLGLTRALTHFADRIAWLGVLRAPWCGLTWSDLHELCGDDTRSTVWDLLADQRRIARLSPSGQRRVAATTAVLTEAFASRDVAAARELGRSDVAAFGRPRMRGHRCRPSAGRAIFRDSRPPRAAGRHRRSGHA